MTDDSLGIPPPKKLHGWEDIEPIPYVILGDEGFPLLPNLMRPYPQRELDNAQKVYNYRLSRTRRLIENTFGILVATWRVFSRKIDLEPRKVRNIVLCCCALHNFLRSSRTPPVGHTPDILPLVTMEGDCVEDIENINRPPSSEAMSVRDRFCEYLNTVSSYHWQTNVI